MSTIGSVDYEDVIFDTRKKVNFAALAYCALFKEEHSDGYTSDNNQQRILISVLSHHSALASSHIQTKRARRLVCPRGKNTNALAALDRRDGGEREGFSLMESGIKN